MRKFLFLIIMAVMMLTVTAVFADDLADVRQSGVLKFGTALDYVPFIFEDSNGNITGMDVALMEEIARRMGVKLQTVILAWDGIIDSLNVSQIDVIGGGLSKTEERNQIIDFTRAYYSGEAQFIARSSASVPASVTNETLRGMKIGVQRGSNFQEWIQTNLLKPGVVSVGDVFSFTTVSDAMKALDRGDLNLVIMDQDIYEDRYKASGKYQVFYEGFYPEMYAFGLRKNSTLTDEINTHLRDMVKDGTAQSIANRFFSMNFNEEQAGITRPAATQVVAIPTAAPAASTTCVNAMSFTADVTVKDGTTYNPGSGFRKTWRLYNNGSCTWDSGYKLEFVSGDRMNGGTVSIPTTVRPGNTVDISVDLTAPSKAGTYKGNWQMRSPQGASFGQVIWVSIRVSGNAVQPTKVPDGQKRIVPVINYFYAASNEGHLGDSTTVYWSVSNAGGVTITVNGTPIENSSTLTGSAPVSATIQRVGVHEIKLTAHSVTDDTSASIWYTMRDSGGNDGEGQKRVVPSIDYFYASPSEGYTGDATTVYWSTSNAGGVTISVDGYTISNEGSSGSLQLQAPVQGTGTHTITLTAHSVTDDTSSSTTFTMYERASSGGNTGWDDGSSSGWYDGGGSSGGWDDGSSSGGWDDGGSSSGGWDDSGSSGWEDLTEEDWNALIDIFSEIDWENAE